MLSLKKLSALAYTLNLQWMTVLFLNNEQTIPKPSELFLCLNEQNTFVWTVLHSNYLQYSTCSAHNTSFNNEKYVITINIMDTSFSFPTCLMTCLCYQHIWWTYWLANKIIPWRWVLFDMPPVTELLMDFPMLYGTKRFIILFTRDLYWSLSWSK